MTHRVQQVFLSLLPTGSGLVPPLSCGDTATLCCRGRESPGQLSFPLAFGDSVLGAIVGTVLGRAKSCFSVETVLLPLLPLSWDEQDWLVEGAEGDTQQ